MHQPCDTYRCAARSRTRNSVDQAVYGPPLEAPPSTNASRIVVTSPSQPEVEVETPRLEVATTPPR
jgi:hypothetical protein